MRLNVTHRLCFFDSERYVVSREGVSPISVDGELAIALCEGKGDAAKEFTEWKQDGRSLCPIAAVPEWSQEVLADEADAREYHERPQNRWQREAWRVIRSERAAVQDEWRKRMEKAAT